MAFYDQNRPFGVREHLPADGGGITWKEAAYHKRIHGDSFIPPPHMHGLCLEELEARAHEETRGVREAQEAKASAARIEAAPKSIARALLDGPSSKQAKPQRGWRQRVRYLNLFRRCRIHREAASRLGVDESTVRRWRRKYPAFGARCDEIVAERYRQNADDLKLRAGEPRVRPIFFKGKQVGEQVVPDDRALMFLLKLEDAQQARAEAREERREQRAHEIRLKEMEIEARRAERPVPEMPASAARPAAPAEVDSSSESNGLTPVPADIAPPEVVKVVPSPCAPAPCVTGERGPHCDRPQFPSEDSWKRY